MNKNIFIEKKDKKATDQGLIVIMIVKQRK